MQEHSVVPVSQLAACWIIAGSAAILLGDSSAMMVLAMFPGSIAGSVLVLMGFPVMLMAFGAAIAAIQVLNQFRIGLRDFAGLAIDIALLPLIAPFWMVTCGSLVGITVGCLSRFVMSDAHAWILGLEYGTFGAALAIPFTPFVWPVVNRAKRVPRQNRSLSGRVAWPTIGLVAWYLALSILVFLFEPTIVFAVAFFASWLVFSLVYHICLLPRFPRFAFPL